MFRYVADVPKPRDSDLLLRAFAPTFLAALAFEHADGFTIARIQHLTLQSGLCIATLAPAVFFAGFRIRGAFRHG